MSNKKSTAFDLPWRWAAYASLVVGCLLLLVYRALAAEPQFLLSGEILFAEQTWRLPQAVLWPCLAAVGLMLAAPRVPLLGVLIFVAVGYGFPRDSSFSFFCRWGILEVLSGLAALAAAFVPSGPGSRTEASANSNNSRACADGPKSALRIGSFLMVALLAWVLLSAAVATLEGEYNPAVNHHPIQMVDNLILFWAASRVLTRPVAWYVLAIVLWATLAVRIGLHPERLHRNGDLGVLLAMSASLSAAAACGAFSRSTVGPDCDGAKLRSLGSTPGSFVIRCVLSLVAAVLSVSAVAALVKSDNRGGFVAFGFAMLVFAAVELWNRRFWLVFGVFVPVALVAGLAVADHSLIERFRRIADADSRDRETVDSRLAIYRAGARMAIDRPLLGVGLGNFEPMMERYDPEGRSDSPHNNAIGMFAESGVVGGLLYCSLFGFSAFAALRLAKTGLPLGTELLLAGLACVLVAYMVGGMFMTRHTFWLAYLSAGGICGLVDATPPPRTGSGH